MANIITSFRILCSIVLLFFPAFSPWFYILYIICGFTDMIDGTIARKTDSVSEFGSKLDTVADFIFVVACLIKMLPAIGIPTWLLIWIVLIAVIKIINVVSGFVCCMKFVAVHTVMNKVTGLLLFILPLTMPYIEMKYSVIFVCGVATFAAIQEGHFIRAYDPDKHIVENSEDMNTVIKRFFSKGMSAEEVAKRTNKGGCL